MKRPIWLSRWLSKPVSNPGRELAMIGVRARRAPILAKTRELRRELGLPPLAILEDRPC